MRTGLVCLLAPIVLLGAAAAAWPAEDAGTPAPQASPHARKMRPQSIRLAPGEAGTLAILLDAQGDEMLFSFVLTYDAAQLEYVSATVGRALPAGSTFDTVRLSRPGQQGFAIYGPNGTGVPAGEQCPILNVVLRAKPGAAPGVYPLSLTGDETIVARQVGDTKVRNITGSTSFEAGAVTIAPPAVAPAPSPAPPGR
jgi:hypothetical protein